MTNGDYYNFGNDIDNHHINVKTTPLASDPDTITAIRRKPMVIAEEMTGNANVKDNDDHHNTVHVNHDNQKYNILSNNNGGINNGNNFNINNNRYDDNDSKDNNNNNNKGGNYNYINNHG